MHGHIQRRVRSSKYPGDPQDLNARHNTKFLPGTETIFLYYAHLLSSDYEVIVADLLNVIETLRTRPSSTKTNNQGTDIQTRDMAPR